MPTAAPRFCAAPGCAFRQPCPQHGRQAKQDLWNSARGSAADRGYGSRWATFRAWWLDEQIRLNVHRAGLCGSTHPHGPITQDSQCQQQGRIVPGKVLDHAIPVTGPADPRFFDPTALQLLCQSCDATKRQREATETRRALA